MYIGSCCVNPQKVHVGGGVGGSGQVGEGKKGAEKVEKIVRSTQLFS